MAESQASLRDIRVLGKRSDAGDFPVLMAQTLLSKNGEAAAPEVADLLGQIYARNPDMGRKARAELAGVVDVTSMGRLDDAAKIPPGDREPPAQPLLSDLQAVDEMRDGIPDLGDLEDKAEEGAPDEKEPEITWKQQPTFFPEQGETEVITSGPIRLGVNSQTVGQHGMKVVVKWRPLGSDGKVRPTFETQDGGSSTLVFSTVLPGAEEQKIIHPPFKNQMGWDVKIIVPPQSATHGNAGKQHINIYVPD